jgi:hypothetical protein
MSNELYTDDQLLEATGLHIDNVRKLVTWGAVRPAKGGRGRGNVRMWYAHTVRHIACVAALVNAGLSVKMAHTLVYLDILGDIFFDIIDPETLAMNSGDKDGWFDPERPLDPQDDHDFRLIIADGKYVFIHSLTKETPIPKGILADAGTLFRTYVDFSRYSGSVGDDGKVKDLRPKWEMAPGHFEVDPGSLAWQYDKTLEDETAIDWQTAYSAAVSITTVNLSLACKIAMRRLLNIPVFFPKPPVTEAEGGADPT